MNCCNILPWNMFDLYTCPKDLTEAILVSIRLITLAESSRQINIGSDMWLLVITLIPVYEQKEHESQRKKWKM